MRPAIGISSRGDFAPNSRVTRFPRKSCD